MTKLFVLFLLTNVGLASTRKITVYNRCSFNVWPALFTSAGTAPNHATGWVAKPHTRESFTASEDWNGRVWGRTDCDFSSGSTLPQTCQTGGCNGGLECATSGGTGVPPATLAEFNFNGGGVDWYDISAVDGTNLPVEISNNAGCFRPLCKHDINTICPKELSVFDANGDVAGCYTACSANLDGNASNSPNCCSGSHDTPATCPSSEVEHYALL